MTDPGRDCARCGNFLRHGPRTQAIAAELSAHETTVISELLRLMQDERQLMDAEAELRLELLRTEEERWPAMPMMTDACGLRYDEGIALAHEVKNAEGDCGAWRADRPTPRRCKTCRHRREADGHREARATFAQLAEIAELNTIMEKGGDPGYATHIASIYAQMALEAATAYNFGHSGARAPSFLPYCDRYSTPSEHVFCCTRNLHDRCAGWESATARGLGRPTATAPAMAARR